jgi:ribosomal-protein-alanine N-acetyltransferase
MPIQKRVPIIETKRLCLYEMDITDAEGVFQMNNEKLVMMYTGDKPFSSITKAQEFCETYCPYKATGIGRWTLRLKENNDYVDWCGLKKHPNGEVDLGFRLSQKYWGKSLAYEAASECINYGFNTLDVLQLTARVHPKNQKSIDLIQRLSFDYQKKSKFRGRSMAILWNQ